jgi:hypothetical protein
MIEARSRSVPHPSFRAEEMLYSRRISANGGLALPLYGALALCRLGGAAPRLTTAVRLLAAGIANGVAGTVTAAADAGEQLAGIMLSHTTTVNE